MPLDKDLNIPPYNDDFDEEKRYHRILARPSTALQAREFNQSQSILQNQIERFGNHIFKDGSIVQGCPVTYYPNVHYISLSDYFNTNTTLNVTDFDNTYLITNSTNSNNAVRAVLKIAKNGQEESYPDTNRVYLDYVVTGTDVSNNDVSLFAPGDTLYFYSPVQGKFANLDSNNLIDTIDTLPSNGSFTSNGFSYCMSVGEGIIFQKGHFIKVPSHIINVRDYTTNVVNYVVGFDTIEEIIDEYDDDSLYDNALGYPNENAPGAHRLKLTPTLVSKSRSDIANNTNFFAIVEFDNFSPTKQADDPVYAAIGKAMADRTYEESGDYVIRPFMIESRDSSNNQTFYYEISPGIAYVRGNRIEKLATTKVETTRGIDVGYAMNETITANYGNYVIVNELLGAFDTESLSEVALYDQAQYSLSQYEGVASALSGSIVGYANIRAVVFETGTRGLSSATYLLYLFNIRMNSGKSFSNDVKSIAVTGSTFGNARADIVLENSIAVLKESGRSSVVFNNGLSATRTVSGNTGIGDTSFVFKQIKSGTIDVTGSIALTIDSAASGGTEKLNSTPSTVLTGPSLDDYDFYVSSNIYSANVGGTIGITSGSAAITGTNFNTYLDVGSIIRVSSNSTINTIRRVTTIANNTYAVLDGVLPSTNASAVYQYFYPGGTPLPIANVTINSNTAFTAQLGINVNSSNTVYCSYPINRSSAVAVPKKINKSVYVKLDLSNNAANTVGPWDLGFCDVHKIRNVYVGTTYANTNSDRLNWFTLSSGQTDDFYDHSKLVIKPEFASQVNNTVKMLVLLDTFTQNTTTSVGFFSVESYPIDDANTANTNAIQTIEIPTYNGKDLRNIIDFRPRKFNTANVLATAIADATINPVVSNTSYNVAAGGHYMIKPDDNFIADFSYYLPRIDVVTLSAIGKFSVVKGNPNISPRVPFAENDQSPIAEVYVPAYPTATQRAAETYKGIDLIKIKTKGNRRYTMRDIGVLDEKIKRIEYYTVLNALEQQARDLTIPDADGLNRFKNGIFADPFNSHLIGNITDFEYKISIDPRDTVARPYIDRHDIETKYNSGSSNNVVKTSSVITLPYVSEVYANQRFATKYRNTSESVWQWNGKIELYPSQDFFRDEIQTPATNVSLDLATPWEQFANSPWGTMYGDWRTVGTTTAVGTTTTANSTATSSTTTTTSTTTQVQTTSTLKVNTITDTMSLGSYVKDVSINPYMRQRLVAFVCYNMKPRTTLHAFFDDVNVDIHCAPGELSGAVDIFDGKEDAVVTRTGDFGSTLVSDANGFICGVFRIPANKFRTGDRLFQLTNVDDLVTGADAKTTISKTKYTADNVAVTRGSSTITLRQPIISPTTGTQVRDTSTVTQVTTVVPIPVTGIPEPNPLGFGVGGDGGGTDGDPLAQSFPIDNISDDVSGVFITGIGVYFRSISTDVGISMYLCEMGQNTPDSTKIIAQSYKQKNTITTSNTGIVETVFSFDYPVYLMAKQKYAFIIQPDANNPDFEIWSGETGGYDIVSGEQVYSNPFTGIMFTSANRSTWTPYQKEDIKFKIYRANFTEESGYAIFNNDDDDFVTISGINKVNSSIGVEIGDMVYTVNSSSNSVITTTPKARVQYLNELTGELWLDNSTGGFSNTTNPDIRFFRLGNTVSPNNTNHLATTTISKVKNLDYHAVVPQFGILQPSKTQLEFTYKGYTNTNVADAAYVTLENGNEYEFNDTSRHIMSRSNEIASISSNKSSTFKINLSTQSLYVSPVIDMTRKGNLFIENLINNDVTNEHTRYGSALSKYVGKKVILADGQEAEDINVYLTAYKPADTDIKVYVKFRNNEDSEDFNNKVWSILQYADGGEYVYSAANGSDFREYKFTVPTSNAVATGAFANSGAGVITALTGTISIANNSNIITGTGTAFNTEASVGDRIKVISNTYEAIRTVVNITNSTSMSVNQGLQEANTAALSYVFPDDGNGGIVEYTSASGSRYIGFKEFAIKIVLLSSNPVKVPKLNDVRAIALQI